ncbi:hypothetical protein ACIGCZ_37105 [Streptomyces nigra]|uniref:hypothetical protein n=1 Tax=Streptomyces nigra TaxID=1827580 RepID=UPI0037CF60B2
MTTDPQTPVSPSNRRALVHNAITDALSKAGDWVPLSVRIAATRAALAEVDAWHADEPASAGLGVSATPSRTDLRDRIRRAICKAEGFAWDSDTLEPDEYGEVADAVLAVLPPPADRAAIRAAALREAADRYATLTDQNEAYDREQGQLDAEARLQHETVRDVVAGLRRLADEAQQPEPPVHGESVAHLAGLPGRRDQWADDEQADTLPAWLYQRFMVSGVGWDNLDEDDRSYWEHHARAVRRAVARGGFKQPAVDARQDGAQDRG